MKGLLQGIPTFLLLRGKTEIHRLLLPKLHASCLRVVVPVPKEPQIIAAFESDAFAATKTRRLNPASINFCYPPIFSSKTLTLHRQVKAVPISTLPDCTFKYANGLVIPPVLNHGNLIWAIGIIPIDEFNSISIIIRPISSDRIDYFLQPISCQKFSVDLLEFIQPTIASHPVEIVDARINEFDSDEIAMHAQLDELLHIRLNELALVKVDSALKAVRTSKFEVSVLASSTFEDDSFYAVTASIKAEFAHDSFSTKIQSYDDLIQLHRPNAHAHSHEDPLLQPPNKNPNVLPPIRRLTSKKSEILCEQRGPLWRFLDDNGCELQNYDWQNEFAWFKLSENSLNHGRLVKYATNGFYLLIVPRDWICLNIESPCFEFQQEEQLAIDDWSGYIIRADHNETNFPRFRTPDAAEKNCEWQRTRFVLEGNCIKDAPSRLGPLYGLSPPRIKANLPTDWKEAEVIVLGEEGVGRNRARWELFSEGTQQTQDLLSKHMAQKSGWYFLRFYDHEKNLLESCDFRYVASLTEIDYPESLIIPSSNGHEPTEVSLKHNKPFSIISERHRLPGMKRVSEYETQIIIPPQARYDSNELRLDERVPVKLELNRLWWCVAEESTKEDGIEWQDRLLELEESQFIATSSATLWLRLSNAGIITVEYGFSRDNPRKLSLAHRSGIFAIPLREFSVAADLKGNAETFRLWITELTANGAPCDHQVALFRVKKKKWYCEIAHCCFVIEEWSQAQAESHFKELHPEFGFRNITSYTEAQEKGLYGNEFPSKIYQCGHNPQHFVNASSTLFNPTSAITFHIDRQCPEARAHAQGGLPQQKFHVVDDIKEIRQIYPIPVWVECKFCHEFFKKPTDELNEDIYSHLIKAHRDELFERK